MKKRPLGILESKLVTSLASQGKDIFALGEAREVDKRFLSGNKVVIGRACRKKVDFTPGARETSNRAFIGRRKSTLSRGLVCHRKVCCAARALLFLPLKRSGDTRDDFSSSEPRLYIYSEKAKVRPSDIARVKKDAKK